MPSPLAALLTFLFIGYLYWDEFRQPDRLRISWAPFVWMFFAGSRFPSYWLNLGEPLTYRSYEAGSPVDRAVFFALIVWGAAVLARRRINWGRLLADNKLLTLYLLYCLSSLFWTDQPLLNWLSELKTTSLSQVTRQVTTGSSGDRPARDSRSRSAATDATGNPQATATITASSGLRGRRGDA